MEAPPTKDKKKNNRKYVLLFWLLVIAPLIAFASLLLIASSSNLPDTQALANPKTNLATEVYTSDMKVIGTYYRENRSDVSYDHLPDQLVKALVSAEDIRFYDHSGVDFIGLIRAAAYLGKKGGGSTLTQQLAKMLFTEDYENISFAERAFLQKPKEWIIAARLEKQYTKDEIITLYLNRYDFLNQAVGIKSASHVYFNKPVDSLQTEEAAMLVGMLKNSALFNPLRRQDTVLYRRNVVLNQMAKYGFIAEQERDSLRQIPLKLNYQRVSHDEGMAPYFREVLRQELKNILNEEDEDGNRVRHKTDGTNYDLYGDGLKIYTTIDSRLQGHAEKAVVNHLAGELQEDFEKDLGKRKDKHYPFYSGIKQEDRSRILKFAKQQSLRYKMLTGDLCPECNRPGFYVKKKRIDGIPHFHCDESKGGCSHTWAVLDEDSIETIFDTPTKMKVFAWNGDIDTTMTPRDSILYYKKFLHAGLMSVDPKTGYVKAWVGGINYKHFQYDNVYQSHRQVGSTFKPFVYATAMMLRPDKYQPCEELPNQKICIDMPEGQPRWCPDNSDFKYGEMVSLEYALANSINTITASIIRDINPKDVASIGYELGIRSEIPAVPSIALGVAELSLYEMVGANAALVNNGIFIKPIFISRIEDKNGNVIYEAPLEINEAVRPDIAYTILHMMKGVVDGAYNRELGKRMGTGVRLRMDLEKREYDNLKVPMAGKTGTTQNNTDGWFMGLTPDLVTGVWVGAQDPAVRFSRTYLGQGANTALPIYGFYMNAVYSDEDIVISQEDFKPPEGVELPMVLNCKEYYETMNSINFDVEPEEVPEGLFE
jgi:penicillin-binding protein 1A